VIALASEPRAELGRWVACGAVVLLAHAGLAVGLGRWRVASEPAEPAAAMVIVLASVAVAPAVVPPIALPPGPEMTMSDAAPSVPSENPAEPAEEQVEEKIEPKKLERKREDMSAAKTVEEPLPPAPAPEVAIELPRPEPAPSPAPPRQAPQLPAPATTVPQDMAEVTASVAAAPALGQLSPDNSKAVAAWRTQILALIERNKRYPLAAQSRRQEGVAQVLFTLDRNGRVLDSRIAKSSGAAALDAEALALLRRAQPFPAPPPDVPGESVAVALPLRFSLR
jgi:protein TonB